MVYESMLLFGVVFLSGWLFSTLLQQRHALYLRHLMQNWLFLVLAVYFIWFWTHRGQTLAMKTWRIKLVGRDGQDISWRKALCRYLLAWMWVLPGLMLAWALGAKGWAMVLMPAANVLIWGMAALFDRDRQFLHDRIVGTRLIGMAEAAKPNGSKQPA
ncbi:Uncharacterized membrane protein YckC, RDD family [Noviherbaspirillum humi]|uniref:Uncharacterized membrane protein YckC, RDD family n=2 Tax=Noviherbaspirillum humi TaxID=1688639 RepID=A0A239KUS1_9BURK|nr:Uncharacterized membrane protein YckC, RDD family [Noviherbaspirillum humi]